MNYQNQNLFQKAQRAKTEADILCRWALKRAVSEKILSREWSQVGRITTSQIREDSYHGTTVDLVFQYRFPVSCGAAALIECFAEVWISVDLETDLYHAPSIPSANTVENYNLGCQCLVPWGDFDPSLKIAQDWALTV